MILPRDGVAAAIFFFCREILSEILTRAEQHWN